MEVWAVSLDTSAIGALENLYQQALTVVDDESKAHLQKYYHRVDSIRGLIGRILSRRLLKERGVNVKDMAFSKTAAGKPYIDTPVDPPIGYNVTHDNGIVAMAFSSGDNLYPDPPAYRVGVDVMLLQLPKRDTFPAFVEIFSEQLTDLERGILLPPSSAPTLSLEEQLRRFYLIWTLKEAYTKALGLGMGFDFSRIEYDVPNDNVKIDGCVPHGWDFTRFEFSRGITGVREEVYVGVVARYTGKGGEGKVHAPAKPEWLKVYDADRFLRESVEELSPT